MRGLTVGLLFAGLFLSGEARAQMCEYPIADLAACMKRTPRAGHVPTISTPPCGPDGSAVGSIAPQGFGAASYATACGGHDICYETCGAVKAMCDATFDRQMATSCREAYAYPTTPGGVDEDWTRRGTCFARARLYARLVVGAGQPAYDAAQKKACECCPLPNAYTGTLSYHLKTGGPGTSTLPNEQRVTATVALQRNGSSSSYNLISGTATLVQYDEDNGITNCHCTASNVTGPLDPATDALVLDLRAGVVSDLQWSANSILVALTCTGNTDPACSTATVVLAPFALGGMNPACTGSSMITFTSPLQLDGSWNQTCPLNPQTLGRLEEATWSLQGSN